MLLRSLRCLDERGFALLKQRWHALQHVTASPGKIGQIARAALALTINAEGLAAVTGQTFSANWILVVAGP
jgi:hypothetical protein